MGGPDGARRQALDEKIEWRQIVWMVVSVAIVAVVIVGSGYARARLFPVERRAAIPTGAGDVSARQDMAALRADVERLRREVDQSLRGIVDRQRAEIERLNYKVQQLRRERDAATEDLVEENERLRQELHSLYQEAQLNLPPAPLSEANPLEGMGGAPGALLGDMIIPGIVPGQEAVPGAPGDQGLPEAEPVSEGVDAAAVDAAAIDAVAIDAVAKFEPVVEWGRTPEEAASMGANVSSLKGMVGVVTPGVSDAYLTKLGQTLRKQFRAFDNVNVEVFDDVQAAQAFREKNVTDPGHRVLSISKHKSSGRDVILLIRGETAQQVPLEDAAASDASPQEGDSKK